MISFKRLARTVTSLIFITTTAFASGLEDLRLELDGNMHGRSSVDFTKKARNISYVIPKGTQGTVLETRKLRQTGSYGVKIRITKVGGKPGETKAKVNDETWVYFSQKNPWLSFENKDGRAVQDPELALTAIARRKGQGLPPESGVVPAPELPKYQEVIQEQLPEADPNEKIVADKTQTEAGFCTDCSIPLQVDPATKNLQDIKSVQESMPPVIDPNNPWAHDKMIMKYSNSPEVKASIKYAMRNKSPRSRKYCYRYVKRALLGGKIVRSYPPGAYAKQGVRDLKRQGMVNLLDDPKYRAQIKSPEDAPKGAVIVYHNGTNEYGDIQIKTDWGTKGGYVSDFHSEKSFLNSPKARRYARLGKPYKMIGIMVKP